MCNFGTNYTPYKPTCNRQEAVYSNQTQPTLTATKRNDNSQPPAGDQNTEGNKYDFPSNQLLLQQRHDNTETNDNDEEEPPVRSKLPLPLPEDNATFDQEFKDEWTNMSILTQFIGPPATAETLTAGNVKASDDPDRQMNKELEGLKKDFHTDFLNRGQQHLEVLDRAVTRRCILAKLRINIQPWVNTTNNLFTQPV